MHEGKVVGEGSHIYEGKKHAEILALEQAGNAARGATLYLNLEPCSHQGRTGPCADAVITAGIHRVVCSMEDPNPLVAGNGFAKLRAAGIQVEVGALGAEARKLNEAWAKFITKKIPFVTLKCAMSLDGKIARRSHLGASGTGATRTDWITGPLAREHVQQMRHQSDAILTGIGTVLADDPLLTDRTHLPRRRPLLRVVLDSHLRLPFDSRLTQSAQEDVLVFTDAAESSSLKALEQQAIRVERIARASSAGVDLDSVLKRLAEMEITSVLVEGGSHLNTSLLASGLVDKVFLYIAPKIFGSDAIPVAEALATPLHLRNIQVHSFGEDVAVEGYL